MHLFSHLYSYSHTHTHSPSPNTHSHTHTHTYTHTHTHTHTLTHIQEGIVVRVTDDNVIKLRTKLVRSDFIAGNERWNRGKLDLNKLAHSDH
jgi:hypothetical protein